MTVVRWAAPVSARPPAGTVVYAIGDVHGRLDLLERMHAAILGDAAHREAARRAIVYLGDYIDRGPSSRQVLDLLSQCPLPGFEVVHLKGNHEDIALRFLAGSMPNGAHWLRYGGEAAAASYGVAAAKMDLPQLRLAMLKAVPASHLHFLRRLRPWHREGDYFFVHAGVRPGVPLDDQRTGDLIWIREHFFDSDADFGAVVVHGHSITGEPQFRANRIGIDTGAYASGRLTCVALEGDTCTVLQTASALGGRDEAADPVGILDAGRGLDAR